MTSIFSRLENIPFLSDLARTRGWPYIIAWIHRLTGIVLVLYIWYHIYTLSFLHSPGEYDAKMNLFRAFVFIFLEWLLAVPVIFHAFNGGRLILYEIFGSRNDAAMIPWVLGLSMIYILLIGLFMIMGNQAVSPVFFWLTLFIVSICLSYGVAAKIWKSGISRAWKFQRITGAFLLIMVPAHLLFMHLDPSIGHESSVVIARMQNIVIKVIDSVLILGVLYHGGYGLLAIAKDYLESRLLQDGCALLIFMVMAVFAWVGVKVTLFI